MKKRFLITSESVTEGHPDKICDQVSDAILDAIYEKDPRGRVACETLVTRGLIYVAGEISTTCYIEIPQIVRSVLQDIGYTDPRYGFDYQSCGVITAIQEQSSDIAMGVDKGGAGDQGMMFGFACTETPELMPLPIMLAHKLVKRLAQLRKERMLSYLRPDGKSQVTVEYENQRPVKITSVIIGAHHDPDVKLEKLREDIKSLVIDYILPKELVDKDIKVFINATGRFEIGGPVADTGVTGRKIMVDTYGGYARHGGGCFCIKGDALVNTQKGLLRIEEMKNEVEKGILVKTDTHPHKVGEWFDNGVRDTIKIVTKCGYELEGTPNQRIRVIDREGRYRWRRLDSIRDDDWIVIQRKDRLFGKLKKLAEFNYEYKEGTAEKRKNKFFYPQYLTEDYAYLLGLMVGDGNCNSKEGIWIAASESSQVDNIQSLFRKLFGREGKVYGHWVFMAGVELRDYLRHLGLGFWKASEKRVPYTIFTAPKNIVAAFLRGLYDTDGSVCLYGRNRNALDIKYSSVSEILVKEVQQLLLNFGIVSSIVKLRRRNKKFYIDGKERKSRYDIYYLHIKGQQGVKIFKENIGFNLERKREILNKINLDSKRDCFIVPHQRERIKRLWNKLPSSERQKDIANIGRFTRKTSYKSTKELTYSKLKEFLETYHYRFKKDKDYLYLKKLFKMGHFYDRVKKIEKSKAHTFDLYVPQAHTFTANGFVCHNSGKDPTKVDRSATYMARYLAKNIVASGIAERCEVQLAYCIGVRQPVAIWVDTFGTSKVDEEKIIQAIKDNFDLSPQGIIKKLSLQRPIYRKTACYGHFGREDEGFMWEERDSVEIFKDLLRK